MGHLVAPPPGCQAFRAHQHQGESNVSFPLPGNVKKPPQAAGGVQTSTCGLCPSRTLAPSHRPTPAPSGTPTPAHGPRGCLVCDSSWGGKLGFLGTWTTARPSPLPRQESMGGGGEGEGTEATAGLKQQWTPSRRWRRALSHPAGGGRKASCDDDKVP